jgi:hypothetical protein
MPPSSGAWLVQTVRLLLTGNVLHHQYRDTLCGIAHSSGINRSTAVEL